MFALGIVTTVLKIRVLNLIKSKMIFSVFIIIPFLIATENCILWIFTRNILRKCACTATHG